MNEEWCLHDFFIPHVTKQGLIHRWCPTHEFWNDGNEIKEMGHTASELLCELKDFTPTHPGPHFTIQSGRYLSFWIPTSCDAGSSNHGPEWTLRALFPPWRPPRQSSSSECPDWFVRLLIQVLFWLPGNTVMETASSQRSNKWMSRYSCWEQWPPPAQHITEFITPPVLQQDFST